MTTFLLIISLLLNGIAIFSIILLFTRQNRLLEVEKAQKNIVKEMEDLTSTYLIEMKAENESFIDRFQHLNPSSIANRSLEKQTASNKPGKHVAPKVQKQKSDVLIEKEWTHNAGKAFKNQAVKAYKSFAAPQSDQDLPSLYTEKADLESKEQVDRTVTDPPEIKTISPQPSSEELSRNLFVSQIEALQKQGLSIEEIAKTLNRGKTEIELLLKFK